MSLHQFGNTDVMYVEIPHHGVKNKKIGYVLSVRPRAEIDLERLEAEDNEAVIGKYSLKTNPVENQIEILSTIPEEKIYGSSYIVDQLGQEMKLEALWDESIHRKQVNVSDLPPGVYFYVIWTFNTDKKRVIKFIKI